MDCHPVAVVVMHVHKYGMLHHSVLIFKVEQSR